MINYSLAILGTKPGTKKENIQETMAYGIAQSSGNVDIYAFAKHIADHGCVYNRGDIVGLLIQASDCLRELLLEGKRVKLGDLGDFQARLKCTGAKVTEDFTANNIDAVNVTWSPGKPFQNLRHDATFKLVPSLKAVREDIQVIRNEETIQGLE